MTSKLSQQLRMLTTSSHSISRQRRIVTWTRKKFRRPNRPHGPSASRVANMTQLNDRFRFGGSVACVLLASFAVGLTACSSADDELSRFIDDTRKEPGGRVEPI